MFYHVLVETNEEDYYGRKKQYYELDIKSKKDLFDGFVIPCLKGLPLFVNGYQITDVHRFIVKQSDENTEVIVKAVEDQLSVEKKNQLREEAAREGRHTKEIMREAVARSSAQYTKDITKDILKEAKHSLGTDSLGLKKEMQTSSNKIFIVHGRDEHLRTQVENVLRALGLEPIILQEQANIGKTIIEKIEECTDVGFGIVLYTPCDEGRLKSEDGELKPRARQNVVLEHGYLMAKLGRERVCCLVSKNVEFPSDIQGIGYIPANDIDQWKYKIAKELKAAGFDIDMNKL
ncbi:hypothetical protein HMPREF2844_10860 [Neisseria sp. HMSC072F04]|jgi:hypothetical protein|uniref:TIR domain-containing protein n=1 Tax=Neisseria sicca TaxID=490 RepID=UPI0008A1F7F4|nr:nucleotide-binding protein [Neisseria sicca]OFJ86121.1 hypothetical protein HMPREF2844_10860 [Neisseria sp. HMSC072F04]